MQMETEKINELKKQILQKEFDAQKVWNMSMNNNYNLQNNLIDEEEFKDNIDKYQFLFNEISLDAKALLVELYYNTTEKQFRKVYKSLNYIKFQNSLSEFYDEIN